MIGDISPDISFLDLTSALRAAVREHNLVFIADDTHWSAKGHQVVAEALAKAIQAENKMDGLERVSGPKMKKDLILSKDAVMIRNVDGTIRYWSRGAQELYGWEAHDVLGKTSHRLLETVFPAPLEVIEEEVLTKGYWEGQLIHKRRDGSKIKVVSHWDLQQNPTSEDQSITVIEVNGPSKS
jgi:PAS domain S-box-containing protein